MNLKTRENQQIEWWYEKPQKLPLLTTLSGGLTGGALIVVTFVTTSGLLQIIPFFALIGGVYYLFAKTRISYFHRFVVGVAAFVLAGLMLSLYVAIFINPLILTLPLWKHLLRIGIILLCAIPINALIAYTQSRMEQKTNAYIEANDL